MTPSITGQPASRTVTAGQTATFTVTATGTAPLSYQWRRNGVNISGATSSAYTTPATTLSDSGALFSAIVTNAAGTGTSGTAILTVNPATAQLVASPASLVFGNVNVSGNRTLATTLTNSGNSNVTISGVALTGAGLSASGVSAGQTLTPGQSAALNVTFAPSSTGSVTGNATVTSSATNSPATISLSGLGVQPVQVSLTLSWIPSTSAVVGYNVYRAMVSGGSYAKINSSVNAAVTYRDTTVQSARTYYYVVTSVAANKVESLYSPEASITIPAQ